LSKKFSCRFLSARIRKASTEQCRQAGPQSLTGLIEITEFSSWNS